MRHEGDGSGVGRPTSPATNQGAPLLVRIRGLRPALSPAEDRVAEQVLRDARQASSWTISQLAAAADTSETTVLRFCRRLDLAGYPQLRLALAAESAQPRTLSVSRTDISAKDSIDDIIAKIAFTDASAVEETAQQLDPEILAEAARRIGQAGRVDVYGVGASGLVAADLQQKLHRIGCLSFAWSDSHLALTSAALLGRRDVAIAISHTGATKETIESAAMAKERGATTIAITNFPLSPLARASDLVLTTAARETALRSGATASRIAALTVIDCLYIAVAHRNLPAARKAVKSTRVAVSRHQVSEED
ncbi:MAG TPA: MurR/RpiR family transcriptional regulator [Segeticoccus sp.]|uniref:MurR/RpiR family transcriptional regulator n=1 Tax=Segeticoccus sp. TaxID=2706531 RepID=UPI002D7EB92A|nr:MurR/RpiR family transcriptional regulator [Segeticoccus sp.]HET8598771.1 MurR/RpiR family transcriptional regulator [Segeticoccus sp.]